MDRGSGIHIDLFLSCAIVVSSTTHSCLWTASALVSKMESSAYREKMMVAVRVRPFNRVSFCPTLLCFLLYFTRLPKKKKKNVSKQNWLWEADSSSYFFLLSLNKNKKPNDEEE